MATAIHFPTGTRRRGSSKKFSREWTVQSEAQSVICDLGSNTPNPRASSPIHTSKRVPGSDSFLSVLGVGPARARADIESELHQAAIFNVAGNQYIRMPTTASAPQFALEGNYFVAKHITIKERTNRPLSVERLRSVR